MVNRLFFPLLIGLVGVGMPVWAAPRADLAPHKAIYNIKMTAKKSGSPVLNIGGEMFFELQAGCEAWTTDHRFNLNYEYAESPPILVASDFTTYERYDGTSLDFSTRRHRNGELFEEMRGQAVLDKETGGRVIYTMPEGLEFTLAPESYFPMGHTAALREHMMAGKKFFAVTVFDGSDDEGPAQISAFIGKDAVAPAFTDTEVDMSLLDVPAKYVRMAFFPELHEETEPEYEMSAIFHENGIISDMTVEYKEFTVHQSLKALQAGQSEECGPQRKREGNTEKAP